MRGVAIVGQGYMGRTHAEAWTEIGLGEWIRYIVAPGEREWIDLAHGAKFVPQLDEMLLDPEVEAVSICTPTASHAEIAIRALRAGKHVLLEKPISLTLRDAELIRDTAEASGTTLMVAQVVRFFAGYVELRRIRDSGQIGTVLAVRASRALPTPTWAPWWSDAAQSGGVPVDFSIHDFDQANLFLGEPIAVNAVRTGDAGPLETSIEYADGGIAQVLSFPYLPQGSPFSSSIDLIGTTGQASYRLASSAPTQAGVEDGDAVSELLVSTTHGIQRRLIADNKPYVREIEYFVSCLATNTPATLSPTSSAIDALRVSLATVASLKAGARVEVQ